MVLVKYDRTAGLGPVLDWKMNKGFSDRQMVWVLYISSGNFIKQFYKIHLPKRAGLDFCKAKQ